MDNKLNVKILKEVTDQNGILYILFYLYRDNNPIDIFLTVDSSVAKLNDSYVYCMREIDPEFNDPKEFFDLTVEELCVVIARKRTKNDIVERHEYRIPTFKS